MRRRREHLKLIRLRLSTIVAFLLCGVAGVMVYRVTGGWGFVIAACLLCYVGGNNIRRAQKLRKIRI